MTPAQTKAGQTVGLCVNLCEVALPGSTADELERLLATTCQQAGFPYCERLYAGSYFCENYFLGLEDAFHESVRELCRRHGMAATLVIPIFGQAFLERANGRIAELLVHFGDVYDEVVANDAGLFMDLCRWPVGEAFSLTEHAPKGFRPPALRLGLGRLFSKERRDPRYPEVVAARSMPSLSAEAASCLMAQAIEWPTMRALVEVDPTSAVVDASALVESAANALAAAGDGEPGDVRTRSEAASAGGVEVAIHLPYCYATTGRNCGPASIDEPDSEKFRLGRGCSHQCLRVAQGYRTDEGVRYVKHGRTYYFSNPACQIAGVDSWRIVYAAQMGSG